MNGSKTAVMEVIGFLCVPLGSSTIQLHKSLGSRRAYNVQKLVSVVKMATVLQQCSTEEQRSVMSFLWAKGLNGTDIHKEMFPVYSGKCLSPKEVHNWVEKLSQNFRKCESGKARRKETTRKTKT
jgi:hypothetical protein